MDQHIRMQSHPASVGTLGKNWDAGKRVTSSKTWSKGRPSRYIMSLYARALNLPSLWPIDTRKRNGALRIL